MTDCPVPVKKDDVIEISISGMSHEGQGVGKYHGFTVFVPFALPEDYVRVQIEEVRSSFARGKVLDHLSSSDQRTESPCACFEACGGCHLQHLDYGRQLTFKGDIVRNALERIAKMRGSKVLPVIGMETPYAYRNKADYPVECKEGTLTAGFFAPKSHELVALGEKCLIQHPLVEETRETFMSICNQREMRDGFIEASFHRLVIRVGVFSGEVMIIIFSNKPVPVIEQAADLLVSKMPQVKSVYQNACTTRTGKPTGNQPALVKGKPFIRERLNNLDFDISPGSFFQVNPVQAEVLFSKVAEYAVCEGIAVDAYCGTGSIALFLAQKAAKVYGFEVNPEAVKDARHNAAVNGIENVEFIQGDVGVTLESLHDIKPETVVLDPPRKGCDEKVLGQIVSLGPERIVYVSCNPATLARDLRVFVPAGYAVKEIQPIDMFPQTYHIECVVLMSRVEK